MRVNGTSLKDVAWFVLFVRSHIAYKKIIIYIIFFKEQNDVARESAGLLDWSGAISIFLKFCGPECKKPTINQSPSML